MKAPILIPLVATGLLLGCSDANQTQHDQSKLQVAEHKQIIPAWVGGYQGTTPCMGDYRLWALSQESLRCADAVLKGKKGWF